MKHTRFALVSALFLFTSIPAFAAPVIMLQFGSFESRSEAEKRLTDIKSKHSGALMNLTSSVREVKLPPDNLTVYRTQAGPIESREAAQKICAKLASAGDECYIVQTAMMTPAETKVNVAEIPAATVLAPAPTTVSATTLPAVTVPATSPMAMPAAQINPETSTAIAVPAPSATVPDVTSKLTTLQPLPEPVTTLSTTPALEEPMIVPPSADPSPELNAALDKAIAEQDTTAARIKETTTAAEPKRAGRSFWSRLNPFSDDEPEPPVKAADPKLAEPVAAPVEQITAAPLAAAAPAATPAPMAMSALPPLSPPPAAIIPEVRKPVVPVATPVEVKVAPAHAVEVPALAAAPAPLLAAEVKPQLAPIVVETNPVITQAEPMILPPPPAPLKARDREELLAAQTRNATVPPSAPIVTGSLAPADGNVNVEEAKRVPISNAAMMSPRPSAAPAILAKPLLPQTPEAALQPSATDGRKTLWAQVGPFKNGTEALNFWTSYRQAHPDFPVVRVRVTSPYQQQLNNVNQSWLRIGPVASMGFINNLCAGLGPKTGLRCGYVADMGVSLSPQAKAKAAGSRYQR